LAGGTGRIQVIHECLAEGPLSRESRIQGGMGEGRAADPDLFVGLVSGFIARNIAVQA